MNHVGREPGKELEKKHSNEDRAMKGEGHSKEEMGLTAGSIRHGRALETAVGICIIILNRKQIECLEEGNDLI